MVRLHHSNQSNYLVLTDCFIPELGTMKNAAQSTQRMLGAEKLEGAPKEVRLAWTLNRLARRLMHYNKQHYGGLNNVFTIPLETWVVGAPVSKQGLLSNWFDGMPDDYRILIHQTPLEHGGRKVDEIWSLLHYYNHLGLKRRNGKFSHLKESAYELLDGMNQAREGGVNNVKAFIDSTGHPHWYSASPTPA